MLKQRLLLVLCLFPLWMNANNIYEQHYIEKYSTLAIEEMQRSGIPASIKLAQGILESSWGRSDSAIQHNNHFGIKCKSDWTGNSFFKTDDDFDGQGNLIASCFRAYENAEDSYKDHSMFLKSNQRYEILFTYDKTDYISWAIGLQRCGYATNKSYAVKLIDLIERYELFKYDKMELDSAPQIATVQKAEYDASGPTSGPAPVADVYQVQEAASQPDLYLPFEIIPENGNIRTHALREPVKRESTTTAPPVFSKEETMVSFETARFRQMTRKPRVNASLRR